MEILIKTVQLLLSLSLLVLVHEMGHFIAAKVFKIRVEKFYLFFDPWFSLFKIKRKETEYGIGWLPLGGYVKISGMIDESMDKEQLKKEPQPWEFRSKPAWQRLIVMLGGVTVNVIVAILIYIGMLSYWGEEYLPTANLKYGISCDSLAMSIGLQNGDKIVSINDKKIENFGDISKEIIINGAKKILVLRGKDSVVVNIPSGFIKQIIDGKNYAFISPRIPFDVSAFVANSAGKKAGIQKNDKIIGLNDMPITYFDEFRNEIIKHKNEEVKIKLIRKGLIKTITVKVPKEGLLGIIPESYDRYFEFKKVDYNIFSAIPAGTIKAFSAISNYVKQFKLIFSSEIKGYESVGGFISIGNIFPSVWDWHAFWGLTAFLSVILAFMNVLPIPALDGGHVIFLLYELITRRKPSEKFLEYAQYTGMAILLALLIFANGNDIYKLFK